MITASTGSRDRQIFLASSRLLSFSLLHQEQNHAGSLRTQISAEPSLQSTVDSSSIMLVRKSEYLGLRLGRSKKPVTSVKIADMVLVELPACPRPSPCRPTRNQFLSRRKHSRQVCSQHRLDLPELGLPSTLSAHSQTRLPRLAARDRRRLRKKHEGWPPNIIMLACQRNLYNALARRSTAKHV